MSSSLSLQLIIGSCEYASEVIGKKAKISWATRYFICELRKWNSAEIHLHTLTLTLKYTDVRLHRHLHRHSYPSALRYRMNSDVSISIIGDTYRKQFFCFFFFFFCCCFNRIERHGITLDVKINETASDFARISAQYFIWISIRSCLIIYSHLKEKKEDIYSTNVKSNKERKKEQRIINENEGRIRARARACAHTLVLGENIKEKYFTRISSCIFCIHFISFVARAMLSIRTYRTILCVVFRSFCFQ